MLNAVATNEAIIRVNDFLSRAASKTLEISELFGCADSLKGTGCQDKALEVYKTWIAFNSGHGLLHAAYFNYAVLLAESSDLTGAMNALREAIRLKSDFYPPYINLGGILERLGHIQGAVGEWLGLVNQFASVNGESVNYKTMALKQIARVLESANSDAAAEDALRQSLEINAAQLDVIQHFVSLRQRQCKWPVITELSQVKKAQLVSGISPLSIACYTDDPIFQLANAYQYNKKSIGMPTSEQLKSFCSVPKRQKSDRLRIGYVSSDLREHAVGFGMTEVVELHDRKNFEVFAYYCGVPTTDTTNARIRAGVDHWCDINGVEDSQAAAKMRDDGIDIIVDLNGYTKDARTKVFALRPAPIIVNWFGFPSTMGSPYHHYIIADPYIVPDGYETYYSEKVVRMPCYQPNDRRRTISDRRPSRSEAGLPERALVYCCLNGTQKLTALTFGRWMTILRQVPDSVLWLLTGTIETNERLRHSAVEQGVAADRLVVASKKPNPEHLARYPLADLFLDSMPYGSHTTAADAMWMGVPILTFSGRSFASRVCGSLVRSAGIGELICDTSEQYVEQAIALGNDRERLTSIRQRLIAGRNTSLLFDTSQLVANLEDLYRKMWSEFARGDLPRPNLTNLDTYYEIGLEQELVNMELLNDDSYRSLYQEKLAERHLVFPLQPDGRLWRRRIELGNSGSDSPIENLATARHAL
jgi:predicted O-linked N-acetylglucosamine transferase (SPINDLY family)